MSKRKKRKGTSYKKQDNTFDKLSISTYDKQTKLESNDAPHDKNRTEQQNEESSYMIKTLKTWWSNLTEPQHSNRIVALFTIIIALTGIVYAIFAYKQWVAVNGQLAEMKTTNRPYVIPLLPHFSETPTGDFHQIKITPVYINVGTGPALSITPSHAEIAIDADPGVADRITKCAFNYTGINSSAFLGPGTGQNPIGQAIPTVETRFIQDNERDFILQGKEHVVVFGGIKYTGIHGGDYETTYCYVLDGKSFANSVILPWSSCSCQRMK